MRKRKLLVKNINALTGIDDGKMEQIKRDHEKQKRALSAAAKPKKVKIMKLHEMFKREVGNPTQVLLSELISER